MTNKNKLTNKLKQIENLTVKTNIPLKKYTTMKVGGPADFFVIPKTLKALQKLLLKINHNIPVFIMGKGSNIIPGDKGFKGIIINMTALNKVEITDNTIKAQSGISLSTLAQKAVEHSLTGLEFAAGIPGSLGGALYMNAGAYGQEIKDIIKNCELLNLSGETIILNKNGLKLSYRQSILQEKKLIATKVKLKLKPGNKRKIKNSIKKLNNKRKESQPLKMASAGSIFKRPKNNYSGKLIEEAGLKGTTVGGAQVSKKHAGFIVNLGNATASDIKRLIRIIQKKVYENSGIKLAVEPKFLGEFKYD